MLIMVTVLLEYNGLLIFVSVPYSVTWDACQIKLGQH